MYISSFLFLTDPKRCSTSRLSVTITTKNKKRHGPKNVETATKCWSKDKTRLNGVGPECGWLFEKSCNS
ncbi:hypothetical protein FPOAC1_007070 [Fusarium poae]|uniref:hypothetical protein n=1 Tax=Fusarium poae TaxID=36050 RepID=UPI001CE98081|nr:hypothetical protein FPOAC1_007070 [Fusarium poae]KAG8673752.1 hypothetical protein FPOAC1_007070 [Fusarium poae]